MNDLKNEVEELKERINRLEKDEPQHKNVERDEKEDVSRRKFLKKLGLGALGFGAISLTSASALDVRDSQGFKVYSSQTEYFDVNSGGPVEVKNADFRLASGYSLQDNNGSNIAHSVVASGQVTLSSGTATVDTGISQTDATFTLALGIDDPNQDAKISGRLFWDDSAGTYKVEIVEDTSIGNPTVNYDVVRVR